MINLCMYCQFYDKCDKSIIDNPTEADKAMLNSLEIIGYRMRCNKYCKNLVNQYNNDPQNYICNFTINKNGLLTGADKINVGSVESFIVGSNSEFIYTNG